MNALTTDRFLYCDDFGLIIQIGLFEFFYYLTRTCYLHPDIQNASVISKKQVRENLGNTKLFRVINRLKEK